jgi:ribosomal-protein-serine acetyltransferase
MVSILINDRLLLRSYRTADAAELFRCVDGSRAHLRPWLNWVDTTLKPENSLHFIQHALAQEAAQEAVSLGIWQDQQLIGGIGMHDWDHYLRRAQIGYWLVREAEGRGLMSLAAQRFVGFLFEKLDLNKIEIHYLPRNSRSATLAARLGARVEGVIRDGIKVNGAFEDLVICGQLRKEWKQGPGRIG